MVRDLIVAGVVAMVAIPAAARAEYPDRPVRLIVPFAPGGANDLIARLLANKLGKVLSRPFIIENRPGGGTVIGTAAVASSPPDGYTLLLISPAHTINPHISKTLPFNPLTDFTPIAQITRSAYVLVTAANSSIASVRDLMARGIVFERYEGMQQDDLKIWSPVPGEGVAWFKDPDANLLSLNGPI